MGSSAYYKFLYQIRWAGAPLRQIVSFLLKSLFDFSEIFVHCRIMCYTHFGIQNWLVRPPKLVKFTFKFYYQIIFESFTALSILTQYPSWHTCDKLFLISSKEYFSVIIQFFKVNVLFLIEDNDGCGTLWMWNQRCEFPKHEFWLHWIHSN